MPYGRKRRYPYARRSSRPTKRYRRSAPRYRRRFRKRFVRGRRPATNLVPNSMFVKLRFFDTYSLADGGTGGAYRTFVGNSIYDPDYTGVGGVPSGYTEYAALYNKYRVYGCKIRVRFNASTSQPQIMAGISARYRGSAVSSPTNIQQTFGELRKNTKHVILQNTSSSVGSSGSFRYVTMFRKTKDMVGSAFKDKDLEADFGDNPAIEWFYDIMMCGVNATETNMSVAASVYMTYYVKFFDPAIQATD